VLSCGPTVSLSGSLIAISDRSRASAAADAAVEAARAEVVSRGKVIPSGSINARAFNGLVARAGGDVVGRASYMKLVSLSSALQAHLGGAGNGWRDLFEDDAEEAGLCSVRMDLSVTVKTPRRRPEDPPRPGHEQHHHRVKVSASRVSKPKNWVKLAIEMEKRQKELEVEEEERRKNGGGGKVDLQSKKNSTAPLVSILKDKSPPKARPKEDPLHDEDAALFNWAEELDFSAFESKWEEI
jgi:hypothetical protein